MLIRFSGLICLRTPRLIWRFAFSVLTLWHKTTHAMTVTLMISTYNRPDALRLCVMSALRQTRLPDQIVIGDDGSRPDTAEAVKELQAASPVPITYVWQPDEGFQLAKIRNRSVAAATGEYIIQVDGDIIMDRRFVADHVALARPGVMLRGRRVCLTDPRSRALCAQGRLPRLGLFSLGIEKRRLNALHLLPLAKWLSPRYRKHRAGIMGCNMSFWKKDFAAVNGYDENFVGWGCEDSDLATRMEMNGTGKMDLKFAAIAWHLHHGHPHMDNLDNNQARNRRERTAAEILSPKGLDQYLQ